ncbi:hypothetical protein HUE58_03795 [Candidatus Ruthia endofausta]|uniref:Uncharacterized protein n=1 Tax=Candidatus Ruthia endofausta TaxID=2738852 RepID=A0A6N0HPE7_9GAMM|nr:hypothetical protein [Candidatus Ruthia endofausta]QKQ24269.1 hypothetical protein HUE58_03795 [Candidatus Ruthia endofausta]
MINDLIVQMIFFEGFVFHKNNKQYYKKVAFILHQVTEHYYSCLSLVLTQYKPYTCNLQQLKQAYVKTRYSEYYKIIEKESYLSERVTYLQTLTKQLCEEKIKSSG